MFGVFSKKTRDLRIASAPVPWNKCDVTGKLVALHERQQLAKMNESIRRFQQRIVNYQACASFGRVPTFLSEGPFNIQDNRHGPKRMIPQIKDSIGQGTLQIDNVPTRAKKYRNL